MILLFTEIRFFFKWRSNDSLWHRNNEKRTMTLGLWFFIFLFFRF